MTTPPRNHQRRILTLVTISAAAGSLLFAPSRRAPLAGTNPVASSANLGASTVLKSPTDLTTQAIAPRDYMNGGTRINAPSEGGLTDDDWRTIRGEIENTEYAFRLERDGAHAANRSQRIKATISESGVEVTPYPTADEAPAWFWRLRPANDSSTAGAEVIASGRRAEVKRGNLTEWYQNLTVGIEQGFTIESAPDQDAIESDRLRLELRCETSLNLEPLSPTSLAWTAEDGTVALSYSGLYAYDAHARRVDAAFETSADSPGLVTIALNTAGASYPLTIDPLIATRANRLTANNPASEVQFGFAVAMQGDVCAIASPPDDPEKINPTTGAGFVYIFMRNPSGAWVQANRLDDPTLNSRRAFGSALDLSGHRLVVGAAAFADPGTPMPADSIGAYIFEFEPGTRFQSLAKRTDLPDPSGPSRASGYGYSVAISNTGAYVAVGSPTSSSGGNQTGGRLLIYRRGTDGNYETTASPAHDLWGGQFQAEFSRSLSFDRAGGSLLAVGAPGMMQTGLTEAGAVALLAVSPTGAPATQVTPISASFLQGGRFGSGVSLYGGKLAAGHPGVAVPFVQADGNTVVKTSAGAVHLFANHSGVWAESDLIPCPDQWAKHFGARVSLDDDILVVDSDLRSFGYSDGDLDWAQVFAYPDILAVPAPSRPPVVSGDHVLFGDSGEVFRLHDNGWIRLDPGLVSATPGERLGSAVAGTRDFTVVGSPFFSQGGSTNRGLVSVITYFDSGRPLVSPLPTGAPAGAELGAKVATDGKTIAASAPGFDSGAGLVALYERDASSNWREVGGVTNPDGSSTTGDRFGSAVAIDGEHLVVGAPLDPVTGIWVGRAWVFHRDPTTGQWGTPQQLVPNGARDDFDLFGLAVDVEGDRIIVAEPGDDTAGVGSGAVHVFEKRSGSWQWRAKMVPKTSEVPAGVEVNLGFSVALDGDLVAAGAPAPIISPGSGAGSVSVFARMAGGTDQWGQLARISPSDSKNDDEFGISVLWHDDQLLVGTGLTETIYVLDSSDAASSWRETARIVNPTESLSSGFAHAFAITEDTLVAGIPLAHSGAGELSYFRRPRGWHPTPVYFDTNANGFGSALAIDGDTLVIGADRYTAPGAPGTEHGAAYVLERNPGGAWQSAGVLTANPASAGSRFGAAVAIDRDHLIVGAPEHGGGVGAAWEFTRSHDGQWSRQTIPGGGGQFGSSIAIDGRLAVIGAPARSINGGVHVYQFDISNFGAVLEKIIAPPTLPAQTPGSAAIRFGAAVSIDGGTIAVGAPGLDLAAGVDHGSAYLYERNRNGAMQWGLAKTLNGLPSQSAAAQFGESLDLAGDWLLVGAPGHHASPAISTGPTGAAHLFCYDNGWPGNWGREQVLTPSETHNGQRFGHAVAMSREWIAVGVPGRKSLTGTATGAVEMFLFGAAGLEPARFAMQLNSPNFADFGTRLALGERTLVVAGQLVGPTATTAAEIFALMNHRERWGFDHFGSDIFNPALESSLWGDTADGDRDGRATILEYLMGSSPSAMDTAPPAATRIKTSTPGIDLLRLRFHKARIPPSSDYQLEPQWSPDLKTWYPSGGGPSPAREKDIWQVVVSNDGPGDSWLVDAYIQIGQGEPRAYLRLAARKVVH